MADNERKITIVIGGDAAGGVKAMDDTQAAGSKLGSLFGTIGKAAAVGMAAVGGAAVAGGAALFKLGSTFDDVYDQFRVKTGATGLALNTLKDDFRHVVSDVPTDFAKAGTAITELQQRTQMMGPDLQGLAKQMLELSRITGTDLSGNIKSTQDAFNAWGISVENQGPKLDQLFRASQMSGVGVADLASQLASAEPQLRAAGLSFDRSTALLTSLGKAGLDVSDILPALGKSMASAAADGKSAAVVFQETFDKIKNAPDATVAAGDAMDVFGAKAGPKLASLIREGKLSYEGLTAAITGGKDTILAAGKDTEDFAEKWQTFKNRVLVGLEPLAAGVFNGVGTAMDKIGPVAERVTSKVITTFSALVSSDGPIVGIASAISSEITDKLADLDLGGVAGRLQSNVAGFIGGLRTDIAAGDWTGVGQAVGAAVGDALRGAGDLTGELYRWASHAVASVDWIGLGIEAGKAAVPFIIGLATGILNFDPMVILKGLGEHWFDALMAVIAVGLTPERFTAKIAEVLGRIPLAGSMLEWAFSHFDNFGKAIVGKLWEVLEAFGRGFVEKLGIESPKMATAFKDMLADFVAWLGAWAEDLWGAAIRAMERLGGGIAEHGPAQVTEALAKVKNAIFGFMADAGSWLVDAGMLLIRGLRNGFEFLFPDFKGVLRGVPAAIRDAVGELDNLLLDAGKAVIRGFIRGIQNTIPDVKDILGDLTHKLTSWKGPEAVDAHILFGAGQLVIGGFVDGIDAATPHVRQTLGDLTGDLPGYVARGAAGAGGRSAAEDHRTLNITIMQQPGETADSVVSRLIEWVNNNGPLPIRVGA